MIYKKLEPKIAKNIGIVIPAYNEEKNIIKLVKKIKNKIKNSSIIIVDDSANKKTFQLIKKNNLNIDYIHRGKKLGRGSAVILGLKKLLKIRKVKIFIEMDADLSHDPNELIRNIKFFCAHSLDLLIGLILFPRPSNFLNNINA